MMAQGTPATARVTEQATPAPWAKLHILAFAALLLRLAVAWWSLRITHPDELFQYLEQAHRLVYGYGIVPWEYRLAARNWLLPGTLALLLQGLRAIGLDSPIAYIPVLKSLFALLSVCLVYASYSIGRNMFGERAGRVAAVLAAIWYELLYLSTVATPEVLGTYALMGALAMVMARPSTRRAVLIGLLLGVGIALRVQYALPAVALGTLVVSRWQWRRALFAAGAAAAVFGFAGLIDAWSWGTAFVSYYNNLEFNLVLGKRDAFGHSAPYAYLSWLAVGSVGLHLLAMAYGALQWRRCWPILLLLACVLVPHSWVAHKEYRFVFLAVPLLLLLWADALVYGLQWLRPRFAGERVAVAAIALLAALSTVECVLHGVFARDDRLVATLDLARRSDVAAVLDLSGFWSRSGGFYFLHHDVPLYFRPEISAVPLTALRSLVSHVLIPVTAPAIPGFRVSVRYGSVAVLEQVAAPPSYRRLAADGREPPQAGLENGSEPLLEPK